MCPLRADRPGLAGFEATDGCSATIGDVVGRVIRRWDSLDELGRLTRAGALLAGIAAALS